MENDENRRFESGFEYGYKEGYEDGVALAYHSVREASKEAVKFKLDLRRYHRERVEFQEQIKILKDKISAMERATNG